MKFPFLRELIKTAPLLLLLVPRILLAGDDAEQLPLRSITDGRAYIAELSETIPGLMHKARIPGLSIAIIKDGDIFWYDSFGIKDARTNEAVNDSTIFQAASLSKTVFAYVVMQLMEEGLLDLDTPLTTYLDSTYVKNDERVNAITARMVLSHSTGFPNWRPRDGELEIHFTPGERFSYSGEGYGYLQKVIEHLTGKSLNTLMQERVFEPLNMKHSSFEWRQGFAGNYAVGHREYGSAADRDPMHDAHAAYSLYTTALDYAKFLSALLQGNGLKQATMEKMFSPQIYLDPECTNCTQRKPETLSEHNAWGLGWGLQLTPQGTSFWHWGDQGIYRCYTVAFRSQKIGLVYFTNSENGLSIRDELVAKTIGGTHPAFAWLEYDSYDAPIKIFGRKLFEDGAEAGMAYYHSLKKEKGTASVFPENSVNRLGYQFLWADKLDEAIAIFKLNVEMYPESWNVYDSLGEAYMEKGEDDLAIKYYEKSLELNPDNDNGKRMLEKIRNEK